MKYRLLGLSVEEHCFSGFINIFIWVLKINFKEYFGYGINEGELVGWSFNAILASLDCFLESNMLKKCIQKYFLSSIIS